MTTTTTVLVGKNYPGVTQWTGTLHEIGADSVVVGATGKAYEPCRRCWNYTGHIPGYEGIYAGVCFGCAGTGTGKVHPNLAAAQKSLTKRAKAREGAARRKAAKFAATQAAAQAAAAQWFTVNPDLTAALLPLADRWAPRNDSGEYDDTTDERVDAWLYSAAMSVRNGNIPDWTADTIQGLLDAYLTDRDTQAATQYAGQIGEVVTVTGQVTVALSLDGQWGPSCMVVITDGILTAKAYSTAKWAWAAERGDTLTLTGTVKDRSEYQGTRQTVLARAKVTA